MAGIVDIERLTVTVAEASNTGQAALTLGQVVAKCVPFATRWSSATASDANEASDYAPDVWFDGSNVRVDRIGTTGALEVEVTVGQFDSTVTVQSGTFQLGIGAFTTSEGVTGVDTAKTLLLFSHKQAPDSEGFHSYSCVRGRVADASVLFDRGGGVGSVQIDGHWFLAEADSAFTVQHVIIQITDGNLSNTGTLGTPVTTAKTFLIGSYMIQANATNDNNRNLPYIDLTNTTTITATRKNVNHDVTVSVAAVSFAAGESIERGVLNTTSAISENNITIGTVDMAVAMPWITGPIFKNISTPQLQASKYPNPMCRASLTTSTNLRLEHNTSGNPNDNHFPWEVIQWEVASSGAPRRVMIIQ